MYVSVPTFYFIGLYIVLVNFPVIAESLHQKPLYLEDLEILQEESEVPDQTFRRAYRLLMNFILAALFAAIAEYVILQGVHNKSVVEVVAIVGGNLSVYYETQSFIGRLIIWMCHRCKQNRLRHLSESSEPHELPPV
jgi:hypothetical protein